MASTITITGLSSPGGNETRALLNIDVDYNSNVYSWQVYVPNDVTNLSDFVQSVQSLIEADIDAKEAEWAALDPKTRTFENPITGETVTVDIAKEEIVRPDVPDYHAKRRSEYPLAVEQLDAMWKGSGSQSYIDMEDKIAAVKAKYPKQYLTQEQFEEVLIENITLATQRRLDNFARTRNYDGILSACTYADSPIPKFATEGQYCVNVRATTWATLYQILGEVQSGTRPMPTSFADVEGDLPALVWPAT